VAGQGFFTSLRLTLVCPAGFAVMMINFISSFIIIVMMALCGECRHAFILSFATARNVIVGGGCDVRRKTLLHVNTSLPTDDNVSDVNNIVEGGGAGGSTSIDLSIEQLRQKAARLRAEAQAVEETVLRGRRTRTNAKSTTTNQKTIEYTTINDSCWEMTYRFANEPENNYVDNTNGPSPIQRKIYTGKVQIQFRNDGYSEILPSDDGIAAISSGGGGDNANVNFEKVWGWDAEVVPSSSSSTTSNDELVDKEKKVDMEYLLFSADIQLPPPISKVERFYFQANVNKQGGRQNNNSSSIALLDGSVTVKRNISGPGGDKGWWGVFRGADSILAQFRQVGEFKCRPIINPLNSVGDV
jgi:hypothetical protein